MEFPTVQGPSHPHVRLRTRLSVRLRWRSETSRILGILQHFWLEGSLC